MNEIFGDRWTDITLPLPPLSGDGLISVFVPRDVRVGSPRVTVGADELAIDFEQQDATMLIMAGSVEGAALTVPVRAVVPVRDRSMALSVEVNGERTQVPLELTGAVRLLPARNYWQLPSSLVVGSESKCVLHLCNDGTVPLTDAIVRVGIPGGVLVSGEDSRELRERQRVALVRIDSLAVGQSRDIVFALTPLDPAVTELAVVAEISAANFAATFASPTVPVSTPGQARVRIERVDNGVARFGDVVRFRARVENSGIQLDDVTLHVIGEGVVARVFSLGTLYSGEIRDLGVPVRVNRAGAVEWEEACTFELRHGQHLISITNSSIACLGEAVLVMGAVIGSADTTKAHEVVARIDNLGDAVATDATLTAKRVGDLKAVVDSLSIDGRSVYSVDGAVPIFDAGVALGTLDSGEAREVRFLLRSGTGCSGDLHLTVSEKSGVQTSLALHVDVVASLDRNTGSQVLPASALQAPAPAQLNGGVLSFDALLHQLSPAEATPAAASTPEVLEAPDFAPVADWDTASKRYYADGEVALGRHVLALFSWLPETARQPEVNAALQALRSEAQVVQAQYLAGIAVGLFGMSGFDLAPPKLVRALKQYLAARDGDGLDESSQFTVLARMIEETMVPETLAPWKAAVQERLAAAHDEEVLGESFACRVADAEVAA